jgi:hypothetical protein
VTNVGANTNYIYVDCNGNGIITSITTGETQRYCARSVSAVAGLRISTSGPCSGGVCLTPTPTPTPTKTPTPTIK